MNPKTQKKKVNIIGGNWVEFAHGEIVHDAVVRGAGPKNPATLTTVSIHLGSVADNYISDAETIHNWLRGNIPAETYKHLVRFMHQEKIP